MSTQVAKHVSDLGNQHNNGPHQDQIFDNPSALCLALWAKTRIRLRWGRGEGEELMHLIALYEGSRTYFSLCISPLHIQPVLRSSRSERNASTINYTST